MERDAIRILLDTMIPGQANRWPAASDVIDAQRMAETLAGSLGPEALARLADAGGDMPAILERLAADQPDDARRLTEAVYRAYYTAPAVQAVIRDLAESGPREPSADFDESLLARVRTRGPGPWRS